MAIESYSGYRDILDNITATGLHERRQEWRRRLSEWSGQDLVPLNGAFDTAIEDIEDRLLPVNAILAELPFGPAQDRLRISLRRLNLDDIISFRRELKELSSGVTQDLSDDEIEFRFTRCGRSSPASAGPRLVPRPDRQTETLTLMCANTSRSPRCASTSRASTSLPTPPSAAKVAERPKNWSHSSSVPHSGSSSATKTVYGHVSHLIFLDEGFVKSDSEFAGRAVNVNAWKGLGFQLIVGAPLDKVTALEPDMDLVLTVTKGRSGYSHITELRSADES